MAEENNTNASVDNNVQAQPTSQPKKPIFKKWWFWVIIVLVVAALGSSGLTSTQKEYGVGETAKLNKVSITLNNVENVADTWLYESGSGMKFVGVNFTVTNNSSSTIELNSVYDWTAYADGQKISYSFMASCAASDIPSGSLAAGYSATGNVGFEIPESTKKLEIEFSPLNFSDTKTKFIYNFA